MNLLMNFFFRSIKTRLLTFILLVVLVPLIFLGFTMFRASSSIIEKSVTLNTSESMDQVLDNIEFHLKDMESVATDIIFNPTIINNLKNINGNYDFQDIQSTNEIKSALIKQISVKTGLKSVFLIGDNYFVISSGNTYVSPAPLDNLPELMRQQPWYAKAVANGGRSYFTIAGTESRISEEAGAEEETNQTIRLARLYRDIQSGNPVGVLGIDLEYKVIDSIISKLQTEFNSSLILVDEDGHVIYKRDPADWFMENGKRAEMDIIGLESGVDEIKGHGERLLRIYRTSHLSGWKVIQLIPYSEILAPVRFIQKLTLFLVAVCLISALVISVFVSNRLLKPLQHLVGLMKKVQQGDLDVKLDSIRNDEIGHLSRNFNTMTWRLKEMHSEIYREQELKRQAELSALQAQIQPHFLYNTLDSIKWMAVMRGEQQISDMISALVNLLRNSINLGKETITIRQEIDNLFNYIRIQQMRYLESFEMDVQVDENTLEFGIPKLVLQPLVENAIFHGMEGIDSGGRITVKVSLKEGHILCRISDNGRGITSDQLEAIMEGRVKSKFSGISVKNVSERLKLHYGKEYGLQFISEGGGTEVIVHFPAIPIKEENHSVETTVG